MSILMQKSWAIQVIQKSAAREQRFVVSGAFTNNGVHPGVVGAPIVAVSGNAWSLTIQSKVGGTWVNSTEKIKFPSTASSGFNIQSDDTGPLSDKDFDDLILYCSPIAVSGATDYFVYGNVSCYQGHCIFNPCFKRHVVVDTYATLKQALAIPILYEYIQKHYPERIFEQPVKWPIPIPDPVPFVPIMLPLLSDDLLPAKEATLFRKDETAAVMVKDTKEGKGEVFESFTPVSSVALKTFSAANASAISDRVKLSGIFDKMRLACVTEALPFSILRLLEYDRTAAEKAGGVYTGTGPREVLGYAITDSFGNYVFRFQRNFFDDLSEALTDTAAGENIFLQAKPDLIVQLLDPFDPSTVLYESALNANIGPFKRLNVCFPCGRKPKACNGQGIIQYIGDLLVIQGSTGVRGGAGNIVGSDGKISNGSLYCAAWAGELNLIACLSDDPIKYYTVRYKLPSEPASAWKLVTEDSRLPKFDGVHVLPVSTSIRLSRTIQLDGVVTPNVACYENVENAADADQWITTTNKKADLTTSIYVNDKLFADQQGTVQFRIEGYDASGNKLGYVDETIDLYLDNRGVQADIDPNIQLGGATLGNCALFTLPFTVINGVNVVSDERAPVTIRFRAKQDSGFMGKYAVTIAKGATGNMALTRSIAAAPVTHTTVLPTAAGQSEVGRTYTDTVNLESCFFSGTPDEPGSISDYINLTIRPESSWLEADQNFCAFRIRVDGYIRHTDGENSNPNYTTTEVLIGIERPQ